MGKSVFDEPQAEKPADLVAPGQKPLATRTADYVETGFVAVHEVPGGGVAIGGGDPPGPALHLTDGNLICLEHEASGREACQHLVQWVTEAEGVTKGVGEQPKQIRAFCTRLATASELMELGEIAIFACSARTPRHIPSEQVIRRFRQQQLEQAAEFAQTQGEKDL